MVVSERKIGDMLVLELALADYLAEGYTISWANYDPSMQFAEVVLNADGLKEYTQGSYKTVRVLMELCLHL